MLSVGHTYANPSLGDVSQEPVVVGHYKVHVRHVQVVAALQNQVLCVLVDEKEEGAVRQHCTLRGRKLKLREGNFSTIRCIKGGDRARLHASKPKAEIEGEKKFSTIRCINGGDRARLHASKPKAEMESHSSERASVPDVA